MDNLVKLQPNALSTVDLVDEIASCDAIIADAKTTRSRLCEELLTRAGKDKYIDGHLHTATVVEAGIQWRLDNKRIEEQMGIAWVNKFSKQSLRNAYIKITARKGVIR
jgi:hypothetical protein